MINFFRHLSRIALAIPLCILAYKYVKVTGIYYYLIFMAIYIAVSLAIEPIFNNWELKKIKKQRK